MSTANGNRVTDTGSDTMPTLTPLTRCRPAPRPTSIGAGGFYVVAILRPNAAKVNHQSFRVVLTAIPAIYGAHGRPVGAPARSTARGPCSTNRDVPRLGHLIPALDVSGAQGQSWPTQQGARDTRAVAFNHGHVLETPGTSTPSPPPPHDRALGLIPANRTASSE